MPLAINKITELASTTVDIENPSIALLGGNTWPDDVFVNMTLFDHAPEHEQWVYIGNDSDGYLPIDTFPVSVNQDGRREVSFYIKPGYDGSYSIISQDRAQPNPGDSVRREMAVTTFNVSVPDGPFITVSDCGLSSPCVHRAGTVRRNTGG